MSTQTPLPSLYSLLPAVFRNRDLAQGGPLQALFAALESQSSLVEENLRQLYDDQFIETCAPWVIPYLGRLIGFDPIYTQGVDGLDSRAEVANTIGYRRRKGTLLALQQVATDVSARPVIAVEEFRRVQTTVSMRHVQPAVHTTLNLRSRREEVRRYGPFETAQHTVDIRSITPRVREQKEPETTPLAVSLHGGGRYHVPNVALWMWRYRSFPILGAPAVSQGDGHYFFHPLGVEMALFQHPEARTAFDRLSTEKDVPQPIRRNEFSKRTADFYPASLRVVVDGKPIPLEDIYAADLSCPNAIVPPSSVGIDVETGRIQFGSDIPAPEVVTVDYCFGFAGEMGGGPYDRSPRLPDPTPETFVWTALVGSAKFPMLADAVAAWNLQPAGTSGRILIPGYAVLREEITGPDAIQLAPQSDLLIAAAKMVPNLPHDAVPLWAESFPTLMGSVEIVGLPSPVLANGNSAPMAQCTISGLRIAGQIRIRGAAASVQVEDCTLVPGLGLTTCGDPIAPGEPSVLTMDTDTGGCLCIDHSISGSLALDAGNSVRITSSIVDAGSPCCPAIVGPDLFSEGPALHIEDSTVIGKVHVHAISLASNTIFHAKTHRYDGWKAPVWSRRRQSGCVRFCALPWNSLTPRRYRCLPDSEAHQHLYAPPFITLRYGRPGYCLLSDDVSLALWTGADNGSQIGVWNGIAETEAVRNLQLRVPEYLPATIVSGIFLVPAKAEPVYEQSLNYGITAARPCGCHTESESPPMGIGIRLL
jgi:hypothetical protein